MKKQMFLPRLSLILPDGTRLDYIYKGDPMTKDEMVEFEMKIQNKVSIAIGVIKVNNYKFYGRSKIQKIRKKKR